MALSEARSPLSQRPRDDEGEHISKARAEISRVPEMPSAQALSSDDGWQDLVKALIVKAEFKGFARRRVMDVPFFPGAVHESFIAGPGSNRWRRNLPSGQSG